MSFELFLFQLKKHSRITLVVGIVIALLSVGAIFLYDEEIVGALSDSRAQAPELFSALNIWGNSSLLDHIASLMHGLIMPMLGSLLAADLAIRLFPAMIETREMSLYLSLPLHRGALALIHGAVLLTCLILAQVIGMIGTILAASALKPGELNIAWFAVLNLGQLCLWILSGGIALMLACGMDKSAGTRTRLFLLIGSLFLIAMLGNMRTLPGFVAWLSPYSLLDTQKLAKGRFALEILGMPLIGMLCFLIGIQRFSKRDLPL